ncbi:MAG: hypothetical protein OXU51_09405 [Candidatus Poribacteria bacterium]|nr:hypothetical protein [Candidatus Poribacteria bacterium]
MRFFQCERFFNRLQVCLFLAISLFLACQSSPDLSVLEPERENIDPEDSIEPIARPPTIEETFENLKRENLGDILDEDFRTLRRLVTSKTYLDFLRHNHPVEDQFQNFDEYWEIAALDLSQYLLFLKQHLEKPAEEDIANVHLFAVHDRHVMTREYHGENPERFQDKWAELVKGPGMDIALRHFVDDDRVDGFDLVLLLLEITLYVKETEQADAAFAQELLNKHGEQDALIWIALENPVLIGYILKDFTDVQVFLKWMRGEFHQ